MQQSAYRADIDGLRAIAVVLVLLFHLDVERFQGGFVGVDVFFVISGYLITRIIHGELQRGEFSIWRFYERRIRRIFPALFVMLGIVTALAYWLLLPIDLKNFGQSVAAATLFASNLLFVFEAGYFDADAELKPLLHTWSLAVEEQFYVVFPLVMVLLAWLMPRRLRWALAGLALLSLLLAEWGSGRYPVTTFFISPPRFWELLLGALLALGGLPAWRGWLAAMASWLGLLALGFAAMSYSPHTPFPGLAALLPCVGAVVLIHAGQDGIHEFSANRLLAMPPIVFVGLLSYSLYLWHWPLIVFFKYVTVRELMLFDQFGLAAAALLTAYLSWRYVESPCRRRDRLPRSWQVLVVGGVAMAVGAGVGIAIALAKGLPGRIDPAIVALERDKLYVNYRRDCRPGPLALEQICIRGAEEVAPSFLLLGDSHAGSISHGAFAAARQLGIAGIQLTVPSYRPFLDFGRRGFEWRDVEVDTRLKQLLENHTELRTVIVLAHWRQAMDVGYTDTDRRPVDREQLLGVGLRRLFESYPDRRFVVLEDFPIDDHFGANHYARQLLFGQTPDLGIERRKHTNAAAAANRQLAALASQDNVDVVSLDPIFCDAEICLAVEDGRSLYRDTDHLSLAGALKTVPLFLEILGR